MIIKRSLRTSPDASVQLAEIDAGVRQCLQLLWSCEAVKELGTDGAKTHWLKIAERAWRDFEDDRQLIKP